MSLYRVSPFDKVDSYECHRGAKNPLRPWRLPTALNAFVAPGMHSAPKHIQVEISRAVFGNNIRHLREHLAPAKLCVVMKANAYGHGLEGLLDTAVSAGADCLGICTNDEAATIRRRHPSFPIMRLRAALASELDESADRLDVKEMVGSREVAEYLARLGRRRGRAVPVHVNAGPGMGRTGFLAEDLGGLTSVSGLDGSWVRGIMPHPPAADLSALDSTRHQFAAFGELVVLLRGVSPEEAGSQQCHQCQVSGVPR